MVDKDNSEKKIGAHVSSAGGVELTPLRAKEIGARSFALFTGSSNRWVSKKISEKAALSFRENCDECGYPTSLILPHDNFLINLGTVDAEKRALSLKSFADEIERCELLGLTMLNFHPGSHLNLISVEESMDLIADGINRTLEKSYGVTAVLENVAGQGSNIGHTFEQLAYIISKIEDKERIGVCIDTCHAYSAGYDLATEEGYISTWKAFDEIIGANYLKGIHLNDDKRELGSRIDRHESLGAGTLGKEFFKRFMHDPRFDNMPIILETPNVEIWPQEIEWMYSLSI